MIATASRLRCTARRKRGAQRLTASMIATDPFELAPLKPHLCSTPDGIDDRDGEASGLRTANAICAQRLTASMIATVVDPPCAEPLSDVLNA